MKKSLYKKKDSNGVVDLLKELWNAAVALRGNIEPADYKRYVLPLIFLRFLSLRYEKRRTEIEADIADPQSDLYTTDEQLALSLQEEPDLYTSKQVFLVPEDARWENIIKIARTDEVKLRLDNILALLEKTFPKLKGLLPPIYAGSNLDKENIAGLINLFSKDIFRFEAGGIDKLGRVYEYFIGEFASSEGKRGGEYFTPESIVKLLVAMLCYGIVQPGQPVFGGVPMLRVNNIRNRTVFRDDVVRVDPSIDSKHRRSRLRGGEVLLTLVGANFGEAAVAPQEVTGWNVARAVAVIPITSKYDPYWICFALGAIIISQALHP